MSDFEDQDTSSKAADTSSKPDGATDASAQAEASAAGSSESKRDGITGSSASDPKPKPSSSAMTIIPPSRDPFGNMREERIGGGPSEELTSSLFLKAAAVLVVLGATGALAMAGASYFHGDATKISMERTAATENETLKQTIARLDSEVATLRAGLDQAVKANSSQITRIADRIDRVEKAQIEPNARLAKLTEAVDRLKPAVPTAQPNAPATASANTTVSTASADTTGSVPNAATASVAAAAAPAIKKPPIIDGWVLRNVSDGGALIEGPFGLYDVYPGDPLPGLNRVEAIRRDGGRWVVVTRKGLIVAR